MKNRGEGKRMASSSGEWFLAIFPRINLDGRLLGIRMVGCGGLSTRAQVNTWLGHVSVFPIVGAMYRLYALSAAELKTHFRGCVLLLPFLPATGGPFDGIDVLEEWKGAHIREHTLLLCISWGH